MTAKIVALREHAAAPLGRIERIAAEILITTPPNPDPHRNCYVAGQLLIELAAAFAEAGTDIATARRRLKEIVAANRAAKRKEQS